MSDVAVRRATSNWEEAAVLPAYSRLVVDEGHHLEETAATHLGASVTRRSLARLFNRLDRRERGLLPALINRLSSSKDLLSTASLDLVESRLAPAARSARDKSGALFDLLDVLLQESGQSVLRLTDAFAEHPIWKEGLRVTLDDTLGAIEMLHEGLRIVRERIEGSTRLDEELAPLLNEIRAVARRLQSSGDALRQALDPKPGTATVRWIEVRGVPASGEPGTRGGRERSVAVSCVPLDLSPILREDLFKRTKTAVVTSATLAAITSTRRGRANDDEADVRPRSDNPFAFLGGRLGLTDEVEPRTGLFPSPFRYESQAVLLVPTDIPAPNVDAGGHLEAVVTLTADLAEASEGGLFVLFTSHRDVRAAAAALRTRRIDERWPLLVHGEDARDTLLNRFRESNCAVLVGTASFWEGVDVPGDALRGLVIAKLPFRVPSEPVTAAHCEAIAEQGGDPFTDYMLPHAALRLKQGFGRLIRTSTDRGVILITDPRVVTKGYGAELLKGLPPARRLFGRRSELIEQIQGFYQEQFG
jgi:ATP-dependent DNA helicase DinG